MKASILLICMTIIPLIHAWPFKKCPEIPKNSLINIDFKQIKGNWIVAGTKPKLSEKCKNILISSDDNFEINLHEDYISRLLYFWHKHSSKDYKVETELKTSVLKLKNKAWYSLEKEELNLIGADYSTFLLFYTCSSGVFKYSETFELWTRGEINSDALPESINNSLLKFKLKPEDLSFRTEKDCN